MKRVLIIFKCILILSPLVELPQPFGNARKCCPPSISMPSRYCHQAVTEKNSVSNHNKNVMPNKLSNWGLKARC